MKWQTSMQHLLNGVPAALLETSPEINLQLWDDQAISSPVIHFAEQMEPHDVVRFLKSKTNGHLLQKNKDHFNEDLEMTARWVDNARAYFESSCLAQPTHQEVISFNDKSKKTEMREKMLRFLDGVQGPSLPDAALAIFEELFMNATIDAPKEAQRQGRQIANPENQFSFERHAKKLVISCRDPYGALDVQKFLNRMSEVYQKGAGEAINMTQPGGAGLGCVILFENCTRLIVGCHKGQWTKVTCMIPLGCSQRQRAEMKKSLHRIESPS
jgi:hypothetical protein